MTRSAYSSDMRLTPASKPILRHSLGTLVCYAFCHDLGLCVVWSPTNPAAANVVGG